jgi:hypothetical protein
MPYLIDSEQLCLQKAGSRASAEHYAALSGAFFRKEADLKPHRVRYWLTPKPDPAVDTSTRTEKDFRAISPQVAA